MTTLLLVLVGQLPLEPSPQDTPPTSALTLNDVLLSVERHYPKLRAASFGVTAKEGKLTSSRGAFDTYLEAKGQHFPVGYYEQSVAELELTQPLPLWGLRLSGGYRWGADHPIYGAKAVTHDAGEVFVGLRVPLWRDGPIDEDRLAIRLAELGVSLAQLKLAQARIDAMTKASLTYWKWVGAGQKLAIVRRLLNLAETRQASLQDQVQSGQLAPIALHDNERIIMSRREQLIVAQREIQAAAIALSLFVRDTQGAPEIPAPQRLPSSFPAETEPSALERDERLADLARTRPDLAALRRAIEGAEAEIELARNQVAPKVDLLLRASQDVGHPVRYGPDAAFVSRGEAQVGVGLSVAMPLPLRKARGRVTEQGALADELCAELDLLTQEAAAQVLDSWYEVEAAHRRVILAKRALTLTLELEEAERRKFALGQSNLLFVNTREDQSAAAAEKVVAAEQLYHQAQVVYWAASGAP